jgi:hypothetical protein
MDASPRSRPSHSSSRNRWAALRRAALPAVVALAALAALAARPAAGDGPPDDGAPHGMVSFFAGRATCPPGWMAATQVEGRMVVGVTAALQVGTAIGAPLGDQEDRPHRHVYAKKVTLGPKAIAAADGSNGQGAQAGDYPVMGSTETATSGLPFIQLVACEKP